MLGRGLAPAVAILLFVPTGAGQMLPGAWTHLGGGPDRSGVVDRLATSLDVVASYPIAGPAEHIPIVLTAGMVATPYGPMGLVLNNGTGTCALARVADVGAGTIERLWERSCPIAGALERFAGPFVGGVGVAAYDAVTDAVLVCSIDGADGSIFQSYDASTGDLRWALTPDRLGSVPGLAHSGGEDQWLCTMAAVDQAAGRVVVPLQTLGSRGLVVALDLGSGDVIWKEPLPASGYGPARLVPSIEESPLDRGFQPWSATLTSSGIVVGGWLDYASGAAWLDRDGQFVSMDLASPPEGDPSLDHVFFAMAGGGMAEAAAASGALAAYPVGPHLLVIDPLGNDPERLPLSGYGRGQEPYWASPRWWGDHIIVTVGHAVSAYDSDSGVERWTWKNLGGWRPSDTFVAPPGALYVLAAHRGPTGDEAALFRLDLRDGKELQKLPLRVVDGFPLDFRPRQALDSPSIYWGVRPVPLGDGRLLLVTLAGQGILLGPSEPSMRPLVALTSAYPAAGESVSVTVDAPPGTPITGLSLAWGDGDIIEEAEAGGPIAHQYEDPGIRTIRATAVFPDNRTATTEVPVHVGGVPPLRLNLAQQAFATEHQDLTFGILGILVAVLGAIIALARRSRTKSRLQRELDILQAVRARSHEDPHGAVHEVAAYRTRVRDELARGRLNDSQFSVLRNESTQLLRSLHHRILAPLEGKLSPRYARLLESAIEDNTLTQTELRELTEALETEGGLSVQERLQLAKLVQAWT